MTMIVYQRKSKGSDCLGCGVCAPQTALLLFCLAISAIDILPLLAPDAEDDDLPAEEVQRSSKLSDEVAAPLPLVGLLLDVVLMLLLEGARCGCKGVTDGDNVVAAKAGRGAAAGASPPSLRKSKTLTFPPEGAAAGVIVGCFAEALGAEGAAWKLEVAILSAYTLNRSKSNAKLLTHQSHQMRRRIPVLRLHLERQQKQQELARRHRS